MPKKKQQQHRTKKDGERKVCEYIVFLELSKLSGCTISKHSCHAAMRAHNALDIILFLRPFAVNYFILLIY